MLLVYLPKNSSRSQYVFHLIFKEELGLEFRTTTDKSEFERYAGEKINYSDKRISEEFFVKASGLLFEDEIKEPQIPVAEKESVKVLFPNENDDAGFDIFSAVFFMVSRYEEYLPFEGDEFGRFKAKDSIAFQNDFLHRPIVNIWIDLFAKALKTKFQKLQFQSTSFAAIITYDIDVAYKYKGRSFGRAFGSAVKDVIGFQFKNFKERLQTLLQGRKDPWDVYDDLKQIISNNQLSSVFFFLLADKSEHDRNLHYENPEMKKLVSYVKTFSGIGIHPSFHTSSDPEKVLIEKERLENVSTERITKSRQHYLKFKLPDTYNYLLSAGISEDYSMAFPEQPGFRAGTCKSFNFYDLKNEKVTSLRIFPVTCMDASFVYYLEKSPERSLMEMLALLKEVKKAGGTFIPIFHNDVIGGSSKWKSVHDKLLFQIKSYLKSF